MEIKKEYDIEYQYQLYLKRVGLIEFKMHPQQRIQLRQAFFGSWGQLLFIISDSINDNLSDKDYIEIMQAMKKQVLDFFLSQNKQQN